MDTEKENAFYLQNKDGTYLKYTRCSMTNLYTYVVGNGREHNRLLHSTMVEESSKFSQTDQSWAALIVITVIAGLI